MDTLKFNTFANSPKSITQLPSKLHTQQSFSPKAGSKYIEIYHSPYTNIPELKK